MHTGALRRHHAQRWKKRGRRYFIRGNHARHRQMGVYAAPQLPYVL